MADPRTTSFWQAEQTALASEFLPLVMTALLAGADTAVTLLPPELQALVNWDLFNQAALDYLNQYRLGTLAGITETTRQAVMAAIDEWVRAGEHLDVLRAKLLPLFGKTRADMIAITEITRIFAQGNLAAWQSTGVVSGKRWQTANDERVCPLCGPLHGQIVELNSNFTLTPSVMAASPQMKALLGNNWTVENGIIRAQSLLGSQGSTAVAPPYHVRCILPDNKVVVPGIIEAAAKSFYNGPCVEIITFGGRRIAVTENHPVLTRTGWLAAGQIRKGDDIMGSLNSERIADRINPNNNNVPTRIEDIWNSLNVPGAVTSVTVPASAEDFHGDGRAIKGDVHVIRPNRLLVRDICAELLKHIDKLVLKWGSVRPGFLLTESLSLFDLFRQTFSPNGLVGGRDLPLALPYGHTLPLDRFSLGLIAELDSISDKLRAEGETPHPRLTSQGVNRFARQISPNILPKIWDVLSSVGTSVSVDTSLFEPPSDGLGADPPLHRQFTNRFAGLITADKVMQIRHFDYSGHVYDLQVSDYELYFTDGIITSNCRCWVQPFVSEFALQQQIGRVLAGRFFAKVRRGEYTAVVIGD